MPKISHTLTDIQIKRWISKGEAVAKSDGDGLTFTLSKGGTATWVLRYRVQGGRRRELTIGSYPDVTLAAAREKARALRASIDGGADPAAEKQERKSRTAAAWTMRELVPRADRLVWRFRVCAAHSPRRPLQRAGRCTYRPHHALGSTAARV